MPVPPGIHLGQIRLKPLGLVGCRKRNVTLQLLEQQPSRGLIHHPQQSCEDRGKIHPLLFLEEQVERNRFVHRLAQPFGQLRHQLLRHNFLRLRFTDLAIERRDILKA